MKKTLFALMLMAGLTFAQDPYSTGAGVGAPGYYPPAAAYAAPPACGPGTVWIDGYYDANGYFVNGYCAAPPFSGAYWVAPGFFGGRFVAGYWGRGGGGYAPGFGFRGGYGGGSHFEGSHFADGHANGFHAPAAAPQSFRSQSAAPPSFRSQGAAPSFHSRTPLGSVRLRRTAEN
jgi:hypothetical protein